MTDRCKIVTKIVEGFKTLSSCQLDSKENLVKASSTAEDLLFAVFKAGVSNIKYTEEEKRVIGPLVPSALQGLGYQLQLLETAFSSKSIDSIRIERSGLQFLIDTFKDFPATGDKSEPLEETLKEFVEREGLEDLDDRLKTVEFDPLTDDGKRSSSLEAEIAKLPSNHWWFFD